MANFEEQFSNHNVHTVLSQIRSAIEEASEPNLDEDALNIIDRLKQGIAFIVARLEIASPVLASTAQLDRIQNPIQNCLNQINQFNSNGNVGHLANASNQLDGALVSAASLISLEQPDPQVTAKDAVSFKELAESALNSLRSDVTNVKEESEEASGGIQNINLKIDDQVKRLDTLNTQISAKFEELESLFSKSQSDRNTAFDEIIKRYEISNKEKLNNLEESIQDKIEYIEDKRKDAERIVHLIGNIGITGNFRGAATREGRLANTFRNIALACFLTMAGVILYLGFVSMHEKFDLWLAIFRFAVGFALLVPGVYAARESTKHRSLENRNRKSELELASIDNYLDSLPKDKRDEIKSELSVKYFGNDDEEDRNENEVTSKSLIDLLMAAIKALGGN